MTEPLDFPDASWATPELLLSTLAFGVIYDASWSRRWWQFWKRPPAPVILHFDPPVPHPSFRVTLGETGLFEIDWDP